MAKFRVIADLRSRRTARSALCAVLLVLPGLGAPAEVAKTPGMGAVATLHPCRVPGVEEEVRCGRYQVYENRPARTGRKISLTIVVLPAKGPVVLTDPLVFLAGGGVAPATGYAGFLNASYSHIRRQRDILLVDQRGTGGSNALDCDLPTDATSAVYRDDGRFVKAVQRCREELERKADLRFYTTPLAMDDLDEVRQWLGYSRLNLFGVSYGTRAAMVYLRQHRDRVRTVALQGVVPIDAPMWLEVPRSSQEAFERVLAACAAQPGCLGAFPELRKEFHSLLERLAGKSVTVKSEAANGQGAEITIDDEVLRIFVFQALSSASRIHDLPMLIHLAHQGDLQPLAERIADREKSPIPKGVYLSIVCNEDVPQFEASALPSAVEGTFLGGFHLGREITACRNWIRGWLPQDFRTPVASSVPVLLLTGALDHLTPPRYAEHVARSLGNARSVVLPWRGHNDTDLCVNGVIEDFMIAGNLAGLDTSCLAKTEGLTFALTRDDLAK